MMYHINLPKHISISIIYLLLVFGLFELTNIDIAIQNYFYNNAQEAWLWSKQEPVLKLFFYDAPKTALTFFALGIIISLLFFRKRDLISRYKNGLVIVLLSLIIVPSVVGLLKATTNSACPVALDNYGGEIPYVKVLASYPPNKTPSKIQKCFPAGHASGGFALLSLFFIFTTTKNKKIAMVFATSLGGLMGSYKMIIGDHFISHTLITMGLAWLLICTIAALVQKFTALSIINSNN
ncbi:phosphoesterase PA-phosphatase related protein [Colwellia psychrerythraea]|uniref:Phosphoesterase PA-phosphatase related protein n=1 Tax=Colwellia psychrerythraea TaxID=28229 RepID=A0A099K8P4_COLPS|nr:phosphoesterase PA-phosphatase related protein [Colwellia psychrerythraea]